MRVLIVPDSFKGSTSSSEAARCIAQGLKAVLPELETDILTAADGGEGTTEAVVSGTGGSYHSCSVHGPLGEPVNAVFGVLPEHTAVIEMSQASGLPLLKPENRDPTRTSTYGTGELIRAALDLGCRRILIGIGGSATNDGGAGMAAALGAKFYDSDGNLLPPGGSALSKLHSIDLNNFDPRISETEFLVACDVTNPLCGPNGASYIYAPQKGATPQQAAELDEALTHYAAVLNAQFGLNLADVPGAGAAGGLGAGLMAFCRGTLRPGIDIIFDLLHLDDHVSKADLIFTGEGRTDATSASGKLLSGVGRAALKYHVPVIALTGSIGPGAETLYSQGISAIFPISDGPISLEESLARAPELITGAAERIARALLIGGQLS